MTEQFNENDALNLEKEQLIRRRKELSFELTESGEVFSFQGLKPGAYERLKENDAFAPEGYVTPIDELLNLYRAEGMKVEKGTQLIETEKTTSTITVAPAVSGAGMYGENLMHIKNLAEVEGMDERLAELIQLAGV